MAVIIIAGSGRGAGKTAAGCALIAALPELGWVAVKVSSHWHGVGALEERDAISEKDTGRYLAAGAVRAFLISEISGGSAELVLRVKSLVPGRGSLLVESNRVEPKLVAKARVQDQGPVICLAVLAGAEADWKASLLAQVSSADALVLTGGLSREELLPELREKPCFRLPDGVWATPELVEFVRKGIFGWCLTKE